MDIPTKSITNLDYFIKNRRDFYELFQTLLRW